MRANPSAFLLAYRAFDAPAAVSVVLSQPSHAPFLMRKLWNEFIPASIPPDEQNRLVYIYVASGFKLAPVLREILSHPLIYDSLSEPTMRPVVDDDERGVPWERAFERVPRQGHLADGEVAGTRSSPIRDHGRRIQAYRAGRRRGGVTRSQEES